MTLTEVMHELESKGNTKTKSIYIDHGAKEPLFGVKVGDLTPIQKRIKKNYILSLLLFDTGNSDAIYLTELIADDIKMKKSDLNNWADKTYWYMLSEYTVAWITAESKYGLELGIKWVDSSKENITASGWATLSNLLAIKEDSVPPLDDFALLLKLIEKEIHKAPNSVTQ